MSQLLIGLAGLDKTLSTAVAEHLRDEHGLVIVTIAAPFEEAVAALIGQPVEYVRDPANAHLPSLSTFMPSRDPHNHLPSVAGAVRDMRCEYAHMQHRDFIPNQLEQRLQELAGMLGDVPGFVVPDLLFSNEGDFIRSHSGLVIHLQSQSAARASWGHYGTVPVQQHASDETVIHHGTLRDVLRSVDTAVAQLRAGANKGAEA